MRLNVFRACNVIDLKPINFVETCEYKDVYSKRYAPHVLVQEVYKFSSQVCELKIMLVKLTFYNNKVANMYVSNSYSLVHRVKQSKNFYLANKKIQ